MRSKKAAVFIMLGQSNAVGHGVPMMEQDKIHTPLPNVFGLNRRENQSFDIKNLVWSGYTSCGTNLGEEQDDTYSVPNCLAALWQSHIDQGNKWDLPDLYIVQIAIGAQGVTEGYMWHPDKPQTLIPGVLGTADISLLGFTQHVLRLLDDGFQRKEKSYEVIGLHWRGGENDVEKSKEHLEQHLEDVYHKLFDTFNAVLRNPPTVLHKIVCPDRMNDMDPAGKYLENMHYINTVFEKLEKQYDNMSIFDPTIAPQFIPNVRGNGLFIEDVVHFTPEVNRWIAEEILKQYVRL